jgi:hypothetical protein
MSTIKSSTTLTTAYSVEADTTGALVIQTGATPTTAVTVSSAQVVTLANALPEASGGTGTTTGYYGFKNRIINGGMVIAQRGTTAVTTDSGFPVDRFIVSVNNDGTFTLQQNSTAPAGFNYSTRWTTTAADSSLAAAQYSQIRQAIEGYNIADLGFGTADAKSVTVSFWVRSSLTGTFAGSLRNSAGNRSYVFTYSISVANTWEQKSITIAGDTSGTWETTTSVGIYLTFDLGTGSTYQTTANAWAAGNFWSTSSAVPVISTLNATWYVTGVQLEKGSTATSFDYRPYGTELALCQRYFTKSFATTVAPANSTAAPYEGVGAGFIGGYFSSNFVPFPVTMRAVPTMTYFSSPNGTPTNDRWQIYDGGWANASSLNGSNITVNGFQNSWAYGSATLKGAYYISGHFTASIEL